MKIRIIFFALSFLLLASGKVLYAQQDLLTQRINARYDRVPMKIALQDISERYQVRFSYSEDIIPGSRLVSLNRLHAPLREVLDELFDGTQVAYRLIGDQIILNIDSRKRIRPYVPERQQSVKVYMAKMDVAQKPVIVPASSEPVQSGIVLESVDPRNHRMEEMMLRQNTPHTPSNFELAWQGAFEKDTIHKEYPVRPIQLTFITPLGTNGMESGNITNRISLNLLAGFAGGVEGVELGGFLNVDKSHVRGVQLAGFGNVVGGRTQAVQAAGFFNVNKSSTQSVQAAGFVNVVGDSMIGFQAAGFTNIVKKQTTGTQLAGFLNLNGADVHAFQGAGFTNITKGSVKGAQLAGFLNTAKDLDGFQAAGFLNIARKVNGVQLGFINVADTIEKGLPIGFVSIVRKNGYRKLELSAAEAFYANAAFKTGIERFYNIFAIGVQPGNNYFRWGVGYGVGTQRRISPRTVVNLEGMYYHINEDDVWTTELNEMMQLKLTLGYELGKVTIFGGPTFNLLVSRYFDEQAGRLGSQIAPWTFYDQNRVSRNRFPAQTTNIQMWGGLTGGIRF